MTGVFTMDCPHCRAAHSAFSINWTHYRPDQRWDVAAVCGGCNLAVLAKVDHPTKNVNLPQITGNISKHGIHVLAAWPVIEVMTAPPHTPDAVSKRYADAEFNFQNFRWNAAVGMYRATLDLATKALKAQGSTFYLRLEWLRQQDKVTQDIRDWADHVRVEGNGALHDPDEFTKEDATALRFFSTMFLRYVFEMPGRVAEFRAQQATAEP